MITVASSPGERSSHLRRFLVKFLHLVGFETELTPINSTSEDWIVLIGDTHHNEHTEESVDRIDSLIQ